MKILIVKTSSLGDVIHMLPAVTDAVQALPTLHIDWLVEESFAAIPAWHPAVERVIPIAMRRWKKQWTRKHAWQEMGMAYAALQQHSYDLVIDSQGLLKSALWSRVARGLQAGYDRKSAREPIASWFYQRTFRVSRQQHAIDRNRQLMAHALGYALGEPNPDYGLQGLAKRLPPLGISLPPQSVVGLHATSRADKLWPVEGWKALAHALAAQERQLVLPWGNDEERLRAEDIARTGCNVTVLPRLGLNSLAALIDQCEAVVGVDTGLLHLAAALGKPGLALYTKTPPALTGAISDRKAILRIENLSKLDQLTPSFVSESLVRILQS